MLVRMGGWWNVTGYDFCLLCLLIKHEDGLIFDEFEETALSLELGGRHIRFEEEVALVVLSLFVECCKLIVLVRPSLFAPAGTAALLLTIPGAHFPASGGSIFPSIFSCCSRPNTELFVLELLLLAKAG